MPSDPGPSRKRARDKPDAHSSYDSTSSKRGCQPNASPSPPSPASRPGEPAIRRCYPPGDPGWSTPPESPFFKGPGAGILPDLPRLRPRSMSSHGSGSPHLAGSCSKTSHPKVVSPAIAKPRPAHSSPAASSAGLGPAKAGAQASKKKKVGKRARTSSPGTAPSGSDSDDRDARLSSRLLVGNHVWAQVVPSPLSDELDLNAGDYYVARIEAPNGALNASVKAKWVKGGATFALLESSIMCVLSERAMEIIFDCPTFP
jgi:hypothetical protein